MRILLVAYDNGSHINPFPLGLAYIAAVLKKKGHEIQIYNQAKFHYQDLHLTQFLNENRFDVIGVSTVAGYYQYRKLLSISEAINKSKNRPFYMLGGHAPSPDPEYFILKTKADAVVIGEGEQTVLELIEALESKKSLRGIKGIAFSDGNEVVTNKGRSLIKKIDNIPFPAYELFPIDYYRLIRQPHTSRTDFVMLMLSGRGCKFRCTFCYRMDKGFRPRANEKIIEEIKLLKLNYGITYIVFADELFMSSEDRVVNLCKDFIKTKLNIKWYCNGRLNYAKPDVLKLMKKAGCALLNYGIESMDDQVLKNMKKGLNTKQIIRGIEATLKAGISPGFNILFGNIGDTKETLTKSVEFLLKYDDGAQLRTIRPVTPYPGSPLYDYAIEKKLLKNCEDFYENKHINSDLVTVNFTNLSNDEFHRALLEANTRLIKNYYKTNLHSMIEECEKLYLDNNAYFRGFRPT